MRLDINLRLWQLKMINFHKKIIQEWRWILVIILTHTPLSPPEAREISHRPSSDDGSSSQTRRKAQNAVSTRTTSESDAAFPLTKKESQSTKVPPVILMDTSKKRETNVKETPDIYRMPGFARQIPKSSQGKSGIIPTVQKTGLKGIKNTPQEKGTALDQDFSESSDDDVQNEEEEENDNAEENDPIKALKKKNKEKLSP